MRKNFVKLWLAMCLLAGTTGCALVTANEGSWEIYAGIRAKQISEEPARVEIQSTLIDTIVDSLTKDIKIGDNKISKAE
jgi:(2Fe-2S) ferredoxin